MIVASEMGSRRVVIGGDGRTPGDRAVGGGVLRTAGYLAGVVLGTAASVVLLRYLGVVELGRYVTVMSLVAVAGGIADAGLTLVGQREYVVASGPHMRRRLLGNLLGMRIAITPVAVAITVVFALAAGYDRVLVLGTLVAGVGVLLSGFAAAWATPLTAQLRFGAVTATEMARQLAVFGGMVLLAVAGAGLLPFFAVHVVAGVAGLALTALLIGGFAPPRPRFVLHEWAPVLREAWPVALALVINILYMRVLMVMMSLLATGSQTGLFATSFRILEVLAGVPVLMLGAAFPILARAGEGDAPRLAYALQRLAEVALLVSVPIALALAIAAEPIVLLLGGAEYIGATNVLRLQAVALPGAFMTQVWVLGLVAVRRQPALISVNLLALGVVLILGLALIPTLGAIGAAGAAALGETVLALGALGFLVAARPDLRPRFGFAGKIAVATVCGAAFALVPVGPVASASLALLIYVLVAWASGAVPAEAVQALARRKPA